MTRGFLFLLVLAGCGGSLTVPLYDSETVLSRHPGLRGRVVIADEYRSPEPSTERTGHVRIVGMVNYEGKISADRAHNLRQLFGMAGSLSKLACLPQILVIRPPEGRVIVCDYYRYARYKDKRHNLDLNPGDVVVVPRIYSEEYDPIAPEWGAVERYLTRQITLDELVRVLDR